MSEARSLSIPQLRDLVTDPSELKKGTEIADRGGLMHLARHANKLFADAAGSGAAPYKTQIVFADDKITGRCSCMAARSRPYCKHAAALLVSWARTPEAFAMAEAPPASLADGKAKKSNVKKSKTDVADLQTRGVAQAATVLSELWQTGVQAIAGDRAEQVSELASSLRELGLRRLSVRMLELGAQLKMAARRDGTFSPEAYATSISDMWLTVRKLEKHLGGEALIPEHVEELIGKTWTKKDRLPIEGLELIEYSFQQRTSADGFVLRESRMFDVQSGAHFSEKQILPTMIAKRIPPKPSHAGFVLQGARGSVFPSFAPRRVDVESVANKPAVDAAALARMLDKALPSVTSALAALAERRRDVFAPPWVPVLMRIDWIVPSRGRIRLLDGEGSTMFVSGGREQEEALMSALINVEAQAIFGDVALDGAMPCLLPLAVLGKKDGVLGLFPLGGGGDEIGDASSATAWQAEAKRSGVSTAAVMLGEVRDDLAARFADGASGVTAQFVEPLAARLADLQLGKQADALRAVGAAADVTDRLDGMVKLHQVLGIALTRLVGAVKVDLASLVRLPTMPSVAVTKPKALLTPEAATASEARGELHRYERLYHVGVHYESADTEMLLRSVDGLWGDGTASPFIVRAAAKRPELALEMAIVALSEGTGARAWQRCTSRIAKLTALRILVDSPRREAHHALSTLAASKTVDQTLSAHVRRALNVRLVTKAELDLKIIAVLAASSKDDRSSAIEELTNLSAYEAIPTIRAALRDRTASVRKAAAYGLALLGDVQSLDIFTAWLEGDDHDAAKVGAHALGMLGDTRATGALLAALGRGFSPAIVREALELLGPWVLAPLLDVALAQPELAKRASVTSLVRTFPLATTVGSVAGWIAKGADLVAQKTRALLAADSCSARPDVIAELLRWLEETNPAVLAGDDKDTRTLKRKLSPKVKKT